MGRKLKGFMIEGGYTIWARKILDSDIFVKKPSNWFKLWFYFVMKAQWSEDKKMPKGSFHTTYEWITMNTGITRNYIDHFIRWSKSCGMLATRKATRGMVITVLKYAEYQYQENYKSDTKSDRKATEKRQRSDTILKEGKNINNIPKGMSRDARSSPVDKTNQSTTPPEPMNENIDRSFPRKRLYGDEALNWLLDFFEHSLAREPIDSEKWSRIYLMHLKRKIGLGKVRTILEWASNPDCWWYARLTGFKMLYNKRETILKSMLADSLDKKKEEKESERSTFSVDRMFEEEKLRNVL